MRLHKLTLQILLYSLVIISLPLTIIRLWRMFLVAKHYDNHLNDGYQGDCTLKLSELKTINYKRGNGLTFTKFLKAYFTSK